MSTYTTSGKNSNTPYTVEIGVSEVLAAGLKDPFVGVGLLANATAQIIARGSARWLVYVEDGELHIDTGKFVEICRETGKAMDKEIVEMAESILADIQAENPKITWDDVDSAAKHWSKEYGAKIVLNSRDLLGLINYLKARDAAKTAALAKVKDSRL